MLISRTPVCTHKALGCSWVALQNQVFYFLSFDIKCLKANSCYLGRQCVLLDTEQLFFSYFHFRETLLVASKFGIWACPGWNSLLVFFWHGNPPHSHPLPWYLRTLWSPPSLFLSLELLSSATSHKAARTMVLLEAKGDRGVQLFKNSHCSKQSLWTKEFNFPVWQEQWRIGLISFLCMYCT